MSTWYCLAGPTCTWRCPSKKKKNSIRWNSNSFSNCFLFQYILTCVVCVSHVQDITGVDVVVQGLLYQVLRLVPRQLRHSTKSRKTWRHFHSNIFHICVQLKWNKCKQEETWRHGGKTKKLNWYRTDTSAVWNKTPGKFGSHWRRMLILFRHDRKSILAEI